MKSTECKNRMIPLTFLRSTFWLNRPSLSLFALFCQSVRLIHQNSSDNCAEENQNRVFTRVSILYEEKRREKNRGKSGKIYNIPISQLYRIVSNSCETQTRIRRNYERSSLSLEILELLVDDVTSIIGASLLPLENFTGGNRFKSNDEKHNLLSEQPTSHRPRKVEECEISSKCSWCARSAIERERVAHVRYRTIPPLTSFRSISCRRIPSRCEQRKL